MLDNWRYLKALDDDVHELFRFIEPSKENFSTYSIELARLLMIATQECDVVLKAVCRDLGHHNAKSETTYRRLILTSFPSFPKVEIRCEPFGHVFTPFKAWSDGKTPEWWTGNNKVKHSRDSSFEKANLGNVLEAVSGLLVTNLYLYRGEISPLLPHVGNTHTYTTIVYPLQHFEPKLPVTAAETLNRRTYIVEE